MQPGNARAKECLEENRDKPEFSDACKAEVEKMMEARAADFRSASAAFDTPQKKFEYVAASFTKNAIVHEGMRRADFIMKH